MSTKNLKINQIKIKFTKDKATAYGGIALFAGFLEKINFRNMVKKIIPFEEKSNNSMGVEAKVIGFFATIVCGGNRFTHLPFLKESLEVLKTLFKVKKVPKAGSSLTRDLFNKINAWQLIRSLKQNSFKYITALIPWDRIEEDYLGFDSTVIVRYGNQTGAKKGYNKKKPGRKSHHPIISFLTWSKYVINVKNRRGNQTSAHGIIEFLKETLEYIENRIKIKAVLADAGFYAITFIEKLEELGLKYIIAVPFSPIMQRRIIEIQDWEYIDEGISGATFKFKHKDKKWTKERTYIVIRQEEAVREDKTKGKQIRLFPEMTEYRYQVYISNKEGTAEELWREYRQRPNDENTIKELQNDFGFTSFSMQKFFATEASMIIRVLFYNIFNLFREEFLVTKQENRRETLTRVRYKYIVIPTILSSQARQKVLRLNIVSKSLRKKIEYLITIINKYVWDIQGNSNAVGVGF